MKKIRTKLLLYFLLISVIPVVIIAFFVFQSSKEAIEEETYEHLLSVSMLKNQEINEWIDTRIIFVESFAEVLEKDLIIVSEDSRKIVDIEKHKKIHDITEDVFKRVIEKGPIFFEIFLIEPDDGRVHLSTDKKQIGKIKGHQSYFREGKKETFIENIYYSLSLGKPAMTVSTPVLDEHGEVVAVLAARLKLERVYEIMQENAGLGETGETYLVNKFNFLVSKTKEDEEYVFKKIVYTEAINDCLNKNNGRGLYENYDGDHVIGHYMWMPEREMCILAEISEEEAFTPVYELAKVIFFIGIIIVMVVFLLAFIFSTTITRPLLQLIKGSEKIGTGDLRHRIHIKSKDEIGLLTNSFNAMAEKLRKRENKLVQTMKKLKELDQLKDDFLNIATHELKTPLVPIQAQVELLLSEDYGKLNKEQREALNMILRNEEQLNSLVSDVLDITKIKSKKLKLSKESIDIVHVINNAIKNVKVAAKKKNITLIYHKQKIILPKLFIDKKRIYQVMGNLLDNSIKFMPNGGEIEVSIKKGLEGIVVSVKDTGIGMSSGTIKKLFTPFYQSESEESRKYEGTGLGLSICKGILEKY
jgi:signal transduction histidine kinase